MTALRHIRISILLTGILVGSLVGGSRAHAQSQSFSDVPTDHWAFQAVEYLKQQEIIKGYDDGTFKPDKKVNRAEAVKIIVAPLLSAEELAEAVTDKAFDDVPDGAWYLPFIDKARRRLKIIDGPPNKPSFHGGRPVLKAEFLKMMLLANGVDPNSYSEIRLPLSRDVTNPDEWFYPYMRYALSASMTLVGEDGNLSPGRELTRGEVAALMHRYIMYKEGRRTQALLSETETEILNVLRLLEEPNIEEAEYASVRALLAARGAHASRPDEGLVKGALKIAEAFRALIRGYRAGLNGNMEEVLRLSGDAWHLATKAQEFSPGLAAVTEQTQSLAKSMADEARSILGQAQ